MIYFLGFATKLGLHFPNCRISGSLSHHLWQEMAKIHGGRENRPYLCIRQTNKGLTDRPETTKRTIITKKDTIMKTMELTQLTVAQYEGQATMKSVMKAVKKGFASTMKFLLFISPVYPQCTQGARWGCEVIRLLGSEVAKWPHNLIYVNSS